MARHPIPARPPRPRLRQRSRSRPSGSRFGDRQRQQAHRIALTELAKAEADAILRREEVTKPRQKSRFQRLLASVDGTIQQIC